MGKPSEIQLLELGPGRGTLMVDILQLAISSKLLGFGQAIKTVHLLEASMELRKQQQAALEKALSEKIAFEFVTGYHPEENDSDNNVVTNDNDAGKPNSDVSSNDEKEGDKLRIQIHWHNNFFDFQTKMEKDFPTMMVAQEFFDALPVHSFQMTEEGWRERMIDVASVDHKAPEASDEKLPPRLRQVLAPDTTPASDMLLSNTPQYRNVPVGTVVEVCPEGMFLVQDMAKVLEASGGYALIIDYGQEGTADSLRAFSNHKQVPLTSYPGEVDITADVDFFALKQCIEEKKEREIFAFGPVTQGEYLMRMGAGEMVIKSIENEETSIEQANNLANALKYLVMAEHMGEKFKVLALGKKRVGIFAPPGMER